MKTVRAMLFHTFLLFLPLFLAAALTGCTPVSASQPPRTEEPVTLQILSVGSSGTAACERISEALSRITLERLGFAVCLSQASLNGYDTALSTRFLNGMVPDLFCYSGAEDLLRYAQEGRALPLDDWISPTSQLRFCQPVELWKYVKINGQIYAVPANNSLNYCLAFCARADIAAELGVSSEDIRSWDALHELLLRVHREYPEMIPVVPHSGSTIPTLGQDPLGDNLGVLMGNTGTQVENLYASPLYFETCLRMRQWYQEGLILPRAFTTRYSSDHMMHLYNGFGFFASINEERLQARSYSYGAPLLTFPLTDCIANSSSVTLGWCVSSSSPYKEQAIELLELLCTDPTVCDLCVYGQEGIDYTRLDEHTVTTPAQAPEDVWEPVSYSWPNRKLASRWVSSLGDIPSMPVAAAYRSPAMGFMFDTDAVRQESNRCLAVVSKYNNALLCGYLDPEAAIPAFLQELEMAGIDTIIQEKQAQLNAWREAQGVS